MLDACLHEAQPTWAVLQRGAFGVVECLRAASQTCAVQAVQRCSDVAPSRRRHVGHPMLQSEVLGGAVFAGLGRCKKWVGRLEGRGEGRGAQVISSEGQSGSAPVPVPCFERLTTSPANTNPAGSVTTLCLRSMP